MSQNPITAIREELGLSVAEFADAVGVRYQTAWNWENITPSHPRLNHPSRMVQARINTLAPKHRRLHKEPRTV